MINSSNINKLIFDTLSARKSVLINGIGTISVVIKGSRKSSPKEKTDFPHYELIINNAPAFLDLKTEVNNPAEYEKWFFSVCKTKGGTKIINIPGSVELKIRKGVIKNIQCSEELELQLNPFFTNKKSNKKILPLSLISIISLCAVSAAIYLIYSLFELPKPISKVEQKVQIPEKVVYTPSKEDIEESKDEISNSSDTTTQSIPVVNRLEKSDTIKINTEKLKPNAPKNKQKVNSEIIEPIEGNNYVVVGSFVMFSKAKEDKARLSKIYRKIDIKTTRKRDGKYINYIYTSTSYDEALNKQAELSKIYEKIKGIWVYQNQ